MHLPRSWPLSVLSYQMVNGQPVLRCKWNLWIGSPFCVTPMPHSFHISLYRGLHLLLMNMCQKNELKKLETNFRHVLLPKKAGGIALKLKCISACSVYTKISNAQLACYSAPPSDTRHMGAKIWLLLLYAKHAPLPILCKSLSCGMWEATARWWVEYMLCMHIWYYVESLESCCQSE